MGEFHDAVTKLLGAFSCGISMIKAQRRKKEQIPIDSTSKKAETHLSKSLKKNRLEVENAYGEDLVRYGPSFADGDAEAHSSLSKILFRLNAVIKRFTTGKTTNTDYQALLNLSNASRIEAINTFEQLSQRLSRSSLALVPLSPAMKEASQRHRHRRKKSSTSSNPKHTRSKSAPELSVTPQGWVRLKTVRKQSSDSTKSSKTSGSSTPKQSTSKSQTAQALSSPSKHSPRPRQAQIADVPYSNSKENEQITPPPQYTAFPAEPLRNSRRADNRKSFMSFASDSTKIGEIPEHRWAQTAAMQAGNYPMTTYYPVEPYQEPEKQRSRLMKLFRR
ncbi:uncharacterized protein LY89DRAFT_729697 [Mollisia scopiformis]|uniref:Uncharacterized protein n=1 Tax=Mollisia scopiformis TaxID=149040 RepID=A0A194XL24_MOLSC|nr:uncharacterized protein LY89DRAFT_729697 [Mollisia scopiformis]KUJ20878.1 hypothetical protein LY89DRAFT_729697 [Mollisia scopiformis]